MWSTASRIRLDISVYFQARKSPISYIIEYLICLHTYITPLQLQLKFQHLLHQLPTGQILRKPTLESFRSTFLSLYFIIISYFFSYHCFPVYFFWVCSFFCIFTILCSDDSSLLIAFNLGLFYSFCCCFLAISVFYQVLNPSYSNWDVGLTLFIILRTLVLLTPNLWCYNSLCE